MNTFKFIIEFISGVICIPLWIGAIASIGKDGNFGFILLIIAFINTYVFYCLTRKEYNEYVNKGPPYID